MPALHYLSYERKQSMNQAYITPIGCIEALPGDNFQHKVTALLRTQPQVAPTMHSEEIKIHHWFVPARLLWDQFEEFITGGPDGLNESAVPVIDCGTDGLAVGSLGNYFGLPTGIHTANKTVSALPFRAYAYIFNEFYRDQDLQDPVEWVKTSGIDETTNKDLLKACWEKDYFTTARPTSQKGDDVQIPLSGNAPIKYDGISSMGAADNQFTVIQKDGGGYTNARYGTTQGTDAGGIPNNGLSNLVADMSDVNAVSINDLRLAVKLQVYKENMLRHGSRYVERLQAAFRVRPQDARLQLPEYLGGGKQLVQFSEVLQTAPSTGAPVGEMAGHGIAAMRSNRYRKFIPEYGFVISFAIIRPKTAYQQGIHRMWSRTVKEDYFQPELQHIGMQGIENQEIYGAHPNPKGVFGFNDRYDEYRFMFDQVAGELTDTLDFWHMGRIFDAPPALNAAFVTCDPTNRTFATDADQFIARFQHSLQIKRLVDATGRPMVF